MTNIKTSWNLVNTYAGLPDFFYSKLNLSKVRSPQLVALNENLAQDLGLNTDELKSREGVEILSGNALPQVHTHCIAYAAISSVILPCLGTAGQYFWESRLPQEAFMIFN